MPIACIPCIRRLAASVGAGNDFRTQYPTGRVQIPAAHPPVSPAVELYARPWRLFARIARTLREIHGEDIARSTFFDGLHNIRRRDVLADLNAGLVLRHKDAQPDLLAALPALAGVPVFAVDGHHVEHAVREEKVERKREGQVADRERRARAAGRKVPAVQKLLPVAVQLTAQYIRSIRNGILVGMRWIEALRHLRASMMAYL